MFHLPLQATYRLYQGFKQIVIITMAVRSILDSEMSDIRDDVLRMSSLVDQAIENDFNAFREHSADAAHRARSRKEMISTIHDRIESHIAETMAHQQPAASDLRNLIADLLISNELDRMADHAAGLAKMVLRKENETGGPIAQELLLMVASVRDMLRRAMIAYVQQNVDDARTIAVEDDRVDALYRHLFERIVKEMHEGTCRVAWGTYLLWAGHSLERIGDRTTNICERIIYAKTGEKDDLNN